ncbi:hypothetical protein PHLCEN_2v4137 [Hermanssonia centrifuga]|uniref:Uncharacterized protein n=1 Tax=Hermanssonia centrifuga TaxID=98765 RepID=A0A2R6PZ46_9APHY|nr:hypothetical protein PHLCEN_2v4137 [Hermanssonia centrifuga]
MPDESVATSDEMEAYNLEDIAWSNVVPLGPSAIQELACIAILNTAENERDRYLSVPQIHCTELERAQLGPRMGKHPKTHLA